MTTDNASRFDVTAAASLIRSVDETIARMGVTAYMKAGAAASVKARPRDDESMANLVKALHGNTKTAGSGIYLKAYAYALGGFLGKVSECQKFGDTFAEEYHAAASKFREEHDAPPHRQTVTLAFLKSAWKARHGIEDFSISAAVGAAMPEPKNPKESKARTAQGAKNPPKTGGASGGETTGKGDGEYSPATPPERHGPKETKAQALAALESVMVRLLANHGLDAKGLDQAILEARKSAVVAYKKRRGAATTTPRAPSRRRDNLLVYS